MISFVVPCYNQGLLIEKNFDRIVQIINNQSLYGEFIFVDDGSVDNTSQQIIRLTKTARTKFTAINFTRNYGQHNATLCGIEHSSGDSIITIDLDKLVDGVLTQIIPVINNNKLPDVIYGIEKNKKQSFPRLVGGYLFSLSFRILFNKVKYVSSTRIISSALAHRILASKNEFIIIDALINDNASSFGIFHYHSKSIEQQSSYKFSKLVNLVLGLYIFYRPIHIVILYTLFTTLTILFLPLNQNAEIFTALASFILFGAAFMYYYRLIIANYKQRYEISKITCN